ncbi:MAG: hypothetical protein OXI66_09375 [Boseongicola sp.]|nr:hypothetical protein [Boseongicola sp.]
MDHRSIQIEERKLALQRRDQNLSAVKFFVGVLLLGVLGIVLDVSSLLHTQNHADRTFLAGHRALLQEKDLVKRLEDIAFLREIGGSGIEYLSLLESQTKAEIEKRKLREELAKKTKERRASEQVRAEEDKIRETREAEKLAEAELEDVEQEIQALRAATQKSYDRALQEAYPHSDLFELKRHGYQIP